MKQLLMFLLFFTITGIAGELKSIAIGDRVAEFKLKNYDGKEVELQKILSENKFTVIMFISTECPVSNGYNDRRAKLYDDFTKKGIAFIGVNANKAESTEDIAEHSKKHGFKFAVVKDVENKVADLYGAQVTPEIFVVNPKGKLLYHGRIDDSRNETKVQSHDLADALETLLAGKELTKTELKAVGCSIKRISKE